MALKVVNGGELVLLEWLFKSTGEGIKIKLFKNDYTPVDASILSNFTEADFTGYVEKTIARTGFGSAATNGSGKAEIAAATQTWASTSTQTIYGYYVVSSTGGALLFAERFASPRSLVSGDSLSLVPVLTLKSEN